jgi:phenylalanyl-tRNA synthetase alpha chain
MPQLDSASPNPLDEASLDNAVAYALVAIESASSLEELKTVKSDVSGDRSPLALANRAIGGLSGADKATAGKAIGPRRAKIASALAARQVILEEIHENEMLVNEAVDVTLPQRRRLGARHPIEAIQERIADFFIGLGWDIAEGPEIEAEWFNFDALNFGPDHPARQMQDTFYVAGGKNLVLRTHTSPVQARSLIERGAPLYVAVPGKVFRTDALDATHTPVFHQVEGLAVDKGLTMANLVGTLDAFAKAMFGPEAKTRLRPSYFPFTEPSAEMDLWFPQKKGGAGWIEWGGCGMVHPNVLKAAGIDADEFQGFAFGMGIERTLMLRHEIADMHDLVEGDVRFTNQFGME